MPVSNTLQASTTRTVSEQSVTIVQPKNTREVATVSLQSGVRPAADSHESPVAPVSVSKTNATESGESRVWNAVQTVAGVAAVVALLVAAPEVLPIAAIMLGLAKVAEYIE